MRTINPGIVRSHILQQSKRANVGHIGSALSIVELLCALYGSILRCASLSDPERDRFVLSKGHAALSLYVVFYLKGWITKGELDSYCGDCTLLGVHPEHRSAGVDFCTGSMGMGIGFAAGAALAARLQGSDRRAFAILSDGECNEGSVWEAAMFAGQHRLSNLTALLDCNGQQAFGYTKDVLNADNLAERWAAFGWDVQVIDGHDIAALEHLLSTLDYRGSRPHLLLARTVFGKGVSYMEGKIKWHYSPMNDQEYGQALREIYQGQE